MFKKIFLLSVFVLAGASLANAGEEKVLLCHETSSETNPFVMISVSANAVDAQIANGSSYAILQEDGVTYKCEIPVPDPV